MWWTLLAVALAADGRDIPVPAEPEPTAVVGAAISPLDARAIAALARDNSTSARKGRADVDLARSEARRNKQRLNPQVGLTARYTRISEEDPITIDPGIPGFAVTIPGAEPDQWHFGLSVILPVSDWLTRAGDIAAAGRSGVAAQEALTEAAGRRAALDAVLAYLGLVRVTKAEAVAEQSIADAERRLAETDKRVRANLASKADVLLAQARIAQARLTRDELGHTRALIIEQLAALLDLPESTVALGSAAFDLSPAASPPESALLNASIASLKERAWSQRPEPRALASGRAAVDAQLALTHIERLPRFDIAANAQLVDPNPRTLIQKDGLVPTWDVTAVVSWKLDGLWQADTAEFGLTAQRASLDADRLALDDGIRLEIEASRRQLRDADAKARAARIMLEAATEGHRVRLVLYAAGSATTLEVTEAETQLERARLGVVDAEISALVGRAMLTHALGDPL
jgi:outer membrane protein TolC